MDVFSKISTNLDSMYYFILNFKHVIPRIHNLFNDYKLLFWLTKGKIEESLHCRGKDYKHQKIESLQIPDY